MEWHGYSTREETMQAETRNHMIIHIVFEPSILPSYISRQASPTQTIMKFNPTTGQLLPAGSADNSTTENTSSNISPSAHANNLTMQNQAATPTSAHAASPAPPAPEIRDTVMSDSALENPAVCFISSRLGCWKDW